jgi:arylsulfatase A-like enzyme
MKGVVKGMGMFCVLIMCSIFGLSCADGVPKDVRPNIIFILADDMGYGDLSSYGRTDLNTPHIDGIAAAGVRFTSHYSNGPSCTPTRTAFMTGRYQNRVGGLECAIGVGNVGRYDDAIRLAERHDLGLPVEETSIARMLKDVGYATAITGKWHLGYEPKFAPHLHGFDYAYYAIGGGMDYFHHTEIPPSKMASLFLNGEPIKREGYFTDLVTEEAIGFIQKNRENPFFLYVPYTAPHSPYQGPDDYLPEPLADDSDLWSQGKGPRDIYIAMIEHMDKCIGDILTTLDAEGLANNTVVIFASDNGGTKSGNNGPLRGMKGATFEGGIRVPAAARWPGHIRAGIESDQACMTMDFTASIARIAGAAPPRPFDGVDIIRDIETERPTYGRTLFWRKHRGTGIARGLRDGTMKFVSDQRGDKVTEYLFDLSVDLSEEHELQLVQPEEFQRLRKMYYQWEADIRKGRRGAE